MLRALRTRYGLSQTALSKRTQTDRSYIVKVENLPVGKSPRVKPEQIVKWGRALGRTDQERRESTDILLRAAGYLSASSPHAGSTIPGGVEEELRRLRETLEQAVGHVAPDKRPDNRAPAPSFFAVVQPRGNVESTPWILKSVPVTRQRLHAGWMEPVDPELPLLIAVPKDSTYLAMRVTGECMEPECSPGDFAILDCDASPQLGEAVVVEVDGEQSLRYLAEQTPTEWVFRAENAGFADLVVSPKTARILGVIVAYQRQPKRLRPQKQQRTG
jgi:transcriptional regulator with XRE-family HTH domain